MKKDFLTKPFIENDNSAKEYKQSLIEYLFWVLENNNFNAMSDHQLYLNGARDVLLEIIEELNGGEEKLKAEQDALEGEARAQQEDQDRGRYEEQMAEDKAHYEEPGPTGEGSE